MNIYVVLFKGIPDVSFHNQNGLAAYLNKQDTTLEKVREDMENNPMPEDRTHLKIDKKGMYGER